MTIKIIPALIAETQKKLEERFNKVANYTSWFHIDVMDGKFVESKSNWFDFKLPSTHKYEIHLMVDNPLEWVIKNYSKGDVIIANWERLDNPKEFIDFLISKNKTKAFGINPETPLKAIFPYLKIIDRILILCVNPGRYGAPFITDSLKKIRDLREKFDNEIEVDGNQNLETIPKTLQAGANVLAVGSYIQNSSDTQMTINHLQKVCQQYDFR